MLQSMGLQRVGHNLAMTTESTCDHHIQDWGDPGWVGLLPHWNRLLPHFVGESASELSDSTSLTPRAQSRGHVAQATLIHARETYGTHSPKLCPLFLLLDVPRDFLLFALPEPFLRKNE